MMNKEMMMNEVVRKFGFEDENTVMFFQLVEVATDENISQTYERLMKMNFCEEEEF